MKPAVLFSFVGNHDPLSLPGPNDDPGPVLSLLQSRAIDHVVLLITGGDYTERAVTIQQAAQHTIGAPTCSFVQLPIENVVDYEEIFGALSAALPRAEERIPYGEFRRFVLLDPGTPQMQTVWFLLVQSGLFDATLLQGVPARFGGGTYRAREVTLDPKRFPVRISSVAAGGRSTDTVAETPGPTGGTPPSDRAVWTVESAEILGRSEPIQLLHRQIDQVARYGSTVLLTGEAGTGKELVARHIHNRSARAGHPYVVVNSATLASGTVESELFGHRRGAFTGAERDRAGRFRTAHGGTLFLDEIGELPLAVQAKLLRTIEYGELTPVGVDTPQQVDVRIIAATNRDLEAMVREGTFREDLLERLRGLPLVVPPLRERNGDVELLAGEFLARWNAEHLRRRYLTDDALAVITAYHWPRNVRQLQNVIGQACSFSETDEIDAAALQALIGASEPVVAEGPGVSPRGTAATHRSGGTGRSLVATAPATSPSTSQAPSPAGSAPAADLPIDLSDILRETERRWYAAALAHTHGNRADAARLLGLKPPAFRKALKERFPELETEQEPVIDDRRA